MNRAIQNILLEYLNTPFPNENRNNASTSRNNRGNNQPGRNVFHRRQIESRTLDTISDIIHNYNQNFTAYQENISRMTRLLEEIHRSQNISSLESILQNIDVSNNQTNQGANTPIPELRTARPSSTNNTIPSPPSTLDWDTIIRYYMYPTVQRSPTGTDRIFSTYLTTRDITNATSTFVYSLSGEEMIDTRCPISLDDFREGDELCQILGCGHVFKRAPLMSWFERNNRCPVCRYNLFEHRRQTNAITDISNSYTSAFRRVNRASTSTIPVSTVASSDTSASIPITSTTTTSEPIITEPNDEENATSETLGDIRNLLNTELNSSEAIQEIANIFSDFMINPTDSRSYVIDSSNNGSYYRFDFTLY